MMNQASLDQPEFSAKTRSRLWQALVSKSDSGFPTQFDAVIIGGGIVGAGLARELVLRKKSVLLVEQNDFASGTSSKSSKLIHGGLRYLEMGDFHLVFEALSERHWLLKTHPHLVTPLQFNLPLYKRKFAPKGQRPGWMLTLGLWLYDALALFHTPFFHGRHSREETLKLLPGIKSEGLTSTLYYADAMMLDDEMVLECIYDSFCRGAIPLNYVQAGNVSEKSTDGNFTVELTDRLPLVKGGTTTTKATVSAKEVIVCVGPWTEKYGETLPGTSERKLKPSRGTHIVFDWDKLPVEHCTVMYSDDGRIIFVIPRKDLGTGAAKTIVGTTDAPDLRDPALVTPVDADIDYLIDALARFFPDRKLTKQDMTTAYAGVRPLIDSGANSEAKTSREHEIWRNKAGIVFMAGGKYTTFRKISEEIADFTFPESSKVHLSKQPLSDPKEYESRFSGETVWGRYTTGFIEWKIRHHCPCTMEDLSHRRIPLWLDPKKIPLLSQFSSKLE